METILENDVCRAVINHDGAELTSFKLKSNDLEYIWQGDPEFWGRHSPVLFPIVGRLKENQYTYNGQQYELSQHGFARDKMFQLESIDEETAVFLLVSDEQTLKVYPFKFELRLIYSLNNNQLEISYEVKTESEEMYFSVGGHPAFNMPLTPDTKFGDFYIQFMPSKSRFLLPLNGPFVDLNEKTLAQTNTSIQLKRDFFENDAFILQTNGTNTFSLLSDKTPHGLSVTYEDMPYVGFWTTYPKESPFVCIEPWAGIADTVEASGEITEKLGINRIVPNEVFKKSFKISIQ